jgi:hypothetical protein
MNTIEKIRIVGSNIASTNDFFELPKIDNIDLPQDIISDFIERVQTDLFEFSTLEQFNDYYNMFSRAFMYVYGKGAEFAFFSRIDNNIKRIDYNFDHAMLGKLSVEMPYHILFHIHRKTSAMFDMYHDMFDQTKGSTEIMMSEGLDFPKCMTTILSGAFFWGQELCSRIELSENDKLEKFKNVEDKPYDYDSYDQRYKEEILK